MPRLGVLELGCFGPCANFLIGGVETVSRSSANSPVCIPSRMPLVPLDSNREGDGGASTKGGGFEEAARIEKMCLAAKHGDIETLSALLNVGVHVNSTNVSAQRTVTPVVACTRTSCYFLRSLLCSGRRKPSAAVCGRWQSAQDDALPLSARSRHQQAEVCAVRRSRA